jgi:hypothetical protein
MTKLIDHCHNAASELLDVLEQETASAESRKLWCPSAEARAARLHLFDAEEKAGWVLISTVRMPKVAPRLPEGRPDAALAAAEVMDGAMLAEWEALANVQAMRVALGDGYQAGAFRAARHAGEGERAALRVVIEYLQAAQRVQALAASLDQARKRPSGGFIANGALLEAARHGQALAGDHDQDAEQERAAHWSHAAKVAP